MPPPARSGIRAILAICVFLVGAAAVESQQVLISEFVASNKLGLQDEDGAYPDWIELYNPGASPVDLNGWHLTDDALDKTKWTFPSVTIGPKGFLVVFASDKNRTAPAKPLHLNFKLSAGGEYLGLVKPDGTTVSSEYAPTFPPQQTDVSYGMAFTGGGTTILPSGAPAKASLPMSNSLGLTWTLAGFNEKNWATGTTGVGYERAAGYESLIGLNLGSMYGYTPTAFIRIPFTVTDAASIDVLTLRMKYDDGFVAYVNGTRVAGANAPDVLAYDSSAVTTHGDSLAVVFEDFDITPAKSSLVPGTNILAIHGLNAGAYSSDFLILPEIEASKLGDIQPANLRYFSVPTPGAPNSAAADTGPSVRSNSHAPIEPSDAQNVVMTVRVAPVANPVASVTLTYRVNYGTPANLAMYDDGAHGDGSAGDGIYGVTVPASVSGPGQMVRYFISAVDTQGKSSRWPLFKSATGSPEFFGWMVQPTGITTPLPVLYWWVQDPNAAKTEAGTQASIYYRGEFYDNVHVRLRGQSSAWWPKPHYKFDMNDGFYLKCSDDSPRAEEFNVQSLYSDKSYIRQVLAWETYQAAGVPYCVAFPIRVQQNGAFHSVAIWLEQPDERLLTRNGMDGDGALYKMFNVCDNAYENVEKKTREEEDNSDLAALVAGVQMQLPERERYLFDNVDIPETINYIAATNLFHDNDHVAKNYYVYRDSDGNGEWRLFPWDKDLTFGRNYWAGAVLNDYIIANVDPYSHPLFGDRNHPKNDGPWNRFIDALLMTPRIRTMYLRRFRTLMDEMLQPPGTPVANRVYETRIDQLASLIASDVALDRAKWGNPYGQNQDLATAIGILKTQFLDVRRVHLYTTHGPPNGIVPAAEPANPSIELGDVCFDPASGNQDEEYVELVNRNAFAVDLSRWRIEGDVEHTIKPGTVLAPGDSLCLSPNVVSFRHRAAAPTGGMSLFVQGDYKGHIPRKKQNVRLLDDAGRLVDRFTTAPIAGTLELDDYLPSSPDQDVTLEIRDAQGAILETHAIVGKSAAPFSVLTELRGTFTLGFRASHWLVKKLAGITIDDAGIEGLSFTLANGDVDGDNAVTVFDYNLLSDAFDSVDGDPGWNANADLDGDGAVTAFDYNILSASFDLTGD